METSLLVRVILELKRSDHPAVAKECGVELDALSKLRPYWGVTVSRGKMYELLNTQMDLLERILNFEESLQEPGRRSVIKSFLMDRLELLKKYWKQVFQGHYGLLHYKDIDSTDYMKDDIFMEAEYSLMASQLMEWLENLDAISSKSPAISIDAQVNRQGFRNSEIKLKVNGRKDELEHREWSDAKVTLSQRRKRNQRSD